MNERAEVRELCSLLRSKVPIVLIETHEEPRILKLLQQACNLENQVLFRWNIVDGIGRHPGAGSDSSIYQTNELTNALKHIDKTRATASTRCATRIPVWPAPSACGSSARSRSSTTEPRARSLSSARGCTTCRPSCCGSPRTFARNCRRAKTSARSSPRRRSCGTRSRARRRAAIARSSNGSCRT